MEFENNNKKINGLIHLALQYHNAKRYGEAAWIYQKVIDNYPKDLKTIQYARTNLDDLKRKIDNLQLIKPKELQTGDPLLDDDVPVNINPDSLSTHTLAQSKKAVDVVHKKLGKEAQKRTKSIDEIFCPSCGEPIKSQAIICVFCGVAFRELLALHGNGKSKTAAIFLSLCMGYWAWLYTARFNWWKFFVGFLVIIVAFYFRYIFPPYSIFLAVIVPLFVAWLWPIIENSARSSAFFSTYYDRRY